MAQQTAKYGKILTNGEIFSYEVYLGEGSQLWDEVDDTGQLNSDNPNPLTLDERKQQLLDEFNPIVNDFTILTTRCRINYGDANPDLEAVIGMVKQVKDLTISHINSLETIDAAMAFHINADTVNYLKDKYKPFLF